MTNWVGDICRWISESFKHHESSWSDILSSWYRYGVATISRLLVIIGLFCKRALWKRRYSARETYDFEKPTNRSQLIDGSEWSKYRKVHDMYWGICESSKNHEVRDATNWVWDMYRWFSESKHYDAAYRVRGVCRWMSESSKHHEVRDATYWVRDMEMDQRVIQTLNNASSCFVRYLDDHCIWMT